MKEAKRTGRSTGSARLSNSNGGSPKRRIERPPRRGRLQGAAIADWSVSTIEATTTHVLGKSVAGTAVRHMLQQLIGSGAAPQATLGLLYFVCLPPGTRLVQGRGSSCLTVCRYHNDIAGHVFYAPMPYSRRSVLGCTGGLATPDALTSTSSHELCEAITDPIPGRGWYDSHNGEICHICAWKTKMVGACTVQFTMVQEGQRVRMTRPVRLPGADMSNLIQHSAIIIKECHTFDDYLGTFPGAKGFTLPQSFRELTHWRLVCSDDPRWPTQNGLPISESGPSKRSLDRRGRREIPLHPDRFNV